MQRRETRGWFRVVQTADVHALAVGDKEKHKQETNFPVITSSTWQLSKLAYRADCKAGAQGTP